MSKPQSQVLWYQIPNIHLRVPPPRRPSLNHIKSCVSRIPCRRSDRKRDQMFMMPKAVNITGRTSTITNSFVNAIIPVFPPTQAEIVEALSVLGMSIEDVRCAYCGDRTTEWDHLRPLVRGKRPTGYVSEITNLVPACGKCNQSKGGQDWRTWMCGSARLCPTVRKVADLQARIARLEAFERWRKPRCVDFEAMAGKELWAQHWQNHQQLLASMQECQLTAEKVRLAVKQAVS